MKDTGLTKDKTTAIKGIATIIILLHHMYLYTGIYNVIKPQIGLIIVEIGPIVLGTFLFITGYGLMIAAEREGYLQTFLKKRFLPLYLFYIVVIALHIVWALLLGNQISFGIIVKSFLAGGSIVCLGWYFQTIFVLYLMYFLTFKLFKNNFIRIAAMGVLIAIYWALHIVLKVDAAFKFNIICFWIGLIYAWQRNKIRELSKIKYVILLALCVIVTTGLFVLYKKYWTENINICFITMAASLIMVIAERFKANILWVNSITKFMGQNSLEIYASQGFFLAIAYSTRIHINNYYVFCLIILFGTFALLFLMKYIYNSLKRIIVK